MDTRMIDVIIGLVLVIALASLVVTILSELHASLLGSRGKTLQQQLNSIGGDNPKFSGALLESPLLKSISQFKDDESKQRAPSYISGQMFVAALLERMDGLTGNERAASPSALIAQLGSAASDAFRGIVPNLQALSKGVEQDWPAFEGRLVAWYDEVGKRATGWFVRQNQVRLMVYGFIVAAALNINPIAISDNLWNDAGLRQNMVAQAELAVNAYKSDPNVAPRETNSKALDSAAKEMAATDSALAELRALLEAWYHQLERTSTAPDDPLVTLIINTQKSLTEAQTYLGRDRKAGIGDPHPQARSELDALVMNLPDFAHSGFQPKVAGERLAILAKRFSTALDNERAKRLGKADAGNSLALLLEERCGAIEDKAQKALCLRLKDAGAFKQVSLPIGWSYNNWPHVAAFDCELETAGSGLESTKCPGNISGMLSDSGTYKNLPIALGGWFMTALAVSLGAPFWFDLLGRLVKVRGSGAKPEAASVTSKSDGAAEPAVSVLARPTTVTELPGQTALPVLPQPDQKLIPFSDAVNEAEHALSFEEIIRIQRALELPPSAQTGRLDSATRSFIQKWQESKGADPNGELTEIQIRTLLHPGEEDDYVG